MRSKRKATGGKYKKIRKTRLSERRSKIRLVRIGKEKRKKLRGRGGKTKTIMLSAEKVNLLNPKTKKCAIVKIKTVLETPSNRYFARRNIITKGTIIETEKGKAKVTNRPSQEGNVQAVLLTE